MSAGAWLGSLLAACIVACGSSSRPPAEPEPEPVPAPAPPAPKEAEAPPEELAPSDVASSSTVTSPPTESPGSASKSTATYEQATSTPESLAPNDDRLHLTDNQLNEPMRGVLRGCRVPPNVRVTIKTAVQYGHAIGVTVLVEFPKPRGQRKTKRVSKEAAKAMAKAIARITTCADHAVRASTWPPSRRRDAFTTTF